MLERSSCFQISLIQQQQQQQHYFAPTGQMFWKFLGEKIAKMLTMIQSI